MDVPIFRGSNLLLGLTSVVGLIGGAYLLQCGAQHLLGKIVDKKPKREETLEEHNCNVCCAELDTSSTKNYVTCCTCGKYVCRSIKCADWLPKNAQWECELCHSSKESMAQTSSWVAEQMSFNQHKFVYPMRARSEIYIPIGDSNDNTMHFESVSQIGAISTAIMGADERSKIREYVEEIVAEMLGGSLEHIKVGQLSKSENYLPAIVHGQHANNNYNNNNNNAPNASSDLGDISQTRLRSLIEAIIAETLRSNNVYNGSAAVSEISLDTRSNGELLNGNGNGLKRRHRTEHYFEPKIYQELLATAVLNKIADKEGNTRLISESTPDLSAHNIDENYNAEALSMTSGSSIEPRSDSSLTDNELVLNPDKADSHISLEAALERESVLSDYIAAHMVPLPDFSASVTESEDDIGSISSSMIGDGTWEDNWLFKKKRSTLQSSGTPSSIGMLVPAPKECVRAQIGDKTADEISDLSEIGSDTDESSADLLRCNALNDRLLSKHLIGGQNTKLVLDEIVERSSLISNTLPAEHEPAITETTNTLLVNTDATAQRVPTPTSDNSSAPPPMYFQDDIRNEPITDQLSLDSNSTAEESATTTVFETFNGDSDHECDSENNETLEKFINRKQMHFNEIIPQPSTNTNHTKVHKPTKTTKTRTNGKLTNGSLKWSRTLDPESQNDDVDDDVLLRRFVPGSIAEREVKKWYNAVEMPNNPYAPEALKQRISGNQERCMDLPNISPSTEQKALALMKATSENSEDNSRETDYKRYSRDYYINDTSSSTATPTSGKAPAISDSTSDQQNAPTDDDIVINEAQKASNSATKAQNSSESENVLRALPAQILDEGQASLETLSSQPTHSIQTSASDDSETVRVYDFNKQETTIIRAATEIAAKSSDTSSSVELSTTTGTSKKRERPIVLQFGPADSVPSIGSPRGSTPPAFRFLQPKRRLIEPSQVLSIDEDDAPEPSPLAEKAVIEQDIAHAMPSVKALAQAFLLTSKRTQPERRWRAKVKLMVPPDAADKPATTMARRAMLTHAVSMAEVADESTITSDLSSLETDPSMQSDGQENPTPIASTASPVPVRRGFLRSNIAFFENLKFK